jgi:hypothetical protein
VAMGVAVILPFLIGEAFVAPGTPMTFSSSRGRSSSTEGSTRDDESASLSIESNCTVCLVHTQEYGQLVVFHGILASCIA